MSLTLVSQTENNVISCVFSLKRLSVRKKKTQKTGVSLFFWVCCKVKQISCANEYECEIRDYRNWLQSIYLEVSNAITDIFLVINCV